ncbi:MAG: glycosyltransferase [Treponema sp.]|nr:glycosyltransferase [Treponema sp.]
MNLGKGEGGPRDGASGGLSRRDTGRTSGEARRAADRPAVLLINALGTGGAERAVAAVAAELRRRGRDLRVLCLERAPSGAAIEVDPPAVLLSKQDSGDSAALKLLALPLLAKALADYVRRENVGTVMSHLFRANFVNVLAAGQSFSARTGAGGEAGPRAAGSAADAAAGRAVGQSTAGSADAAADAAAGRAVGQSAAGHRAILVNHTRVSRLASEGLSGRLTAALTKRLYPRAELVASVSRGSADEVADFVGLPNERSIVLHNPVDTAAAAAAVSRCAPRSVIVAVGRLVALKRFGDLIAAFARLAPDYPDLELHLVGEGPDRLRLQASAANSGLAERIRFLGRLADPFPALAGARAFVSSSEVEGFGIAIVEALAVGLPVVASDCAFGPREILDPAGGGAPRLGPGEGYESGEYGLLYPMGSVEALEAGLRRVLDDGDLARALAARGPERAADFGLERAADAYEALLYPPAERGA